MKNKGETANKAVKMTKKGKKTIRDQQNRDQPSEEQLNLEELAYQDQQDRISHNEADSSGEDEGYRVDYVEENADYDEEEEQPLSQTKRRRIHQPDDGARVSQAVEDKLPPPAQKTRRLAKDLADKEVARLPQAEQSQGQATTNPSLPRIDLSLPINSTLVGAGIQNASSANAYQSVTYSNDGDFIPDSDRGRQMEVPDAGITSITPVSRLERLTRIKTDSVNTQKISRGLEIIRSQESINLEDADFIALHLDDIQIDLITEMYAKDPQPSKLKESSMLLTQDIKRLGMNYTEAHAKQFVEWVRMTDSSLLINQLVDKHAKFTLDYKFKSMAYRFGLTSEFFSGWYETWSLSKLADWVERLYSNVEITTLTNELIAFNFNFKSRGMNLNDSNSRTSEDLTFQRLNGILLKYPEPEYQTPNMQRDLVKILKDKVKNSIFGPDIANSSLPSSTVNEFIFALISVREKIRGNIEEARRYNNAMQTNTNADYNNNGTDINFSQNKRQKLDNHSN